MIQIMRQEKTVIVMVTILTPRKMSFENSIFFLAAAAAFICRICFLSFRFSVVSCRIRSLSLVSGSDAPFSSMASYSLHMAAPPSFRKLTRSPVW